MASILDIFDDDPLGGGFSFGSMIDSGGWLDNILSGFGGAGPLTAAGIGGLLGAFGGGSGTIPVAGYQGGIPRYTATREVIPYSSEGRRPGEYGRQYFTPVTFTPQESAPAAQPETPAPTQPQEEMPPGDPFGGGGNAAGGRITYAGGGLASLGDYSDYARGGRMLKGPGTGQSDDIPATIEGKQPARLARDEFVIPADVVSMLGDGSSDAGAERLYAMMDRVRKAAHGKTQQQKQINPKKVLPA